MKKKYLNLLIVMLTFCLMFINMEEVKAYDDPNLDVSYDDIATCSYANEQNDVTFSIVVTKPGNNYWVNEAKIKNYNWVKKDSNAIKYENEKVYCPSTAYLNYSYSEQGFMGISTIYYFDLETNAKKDGNVELSGTKVILTDSEGDAVMYDSEINGDKELTFCELGGNEKGEELLDKFDEYHSTLTLYDRGEMPSEKKIKKLNEKYNDLFSKLDVAAKTNYCNKTKIDELYVTKISNDLKTLENLNLKNKNLSEKEKEEMNETIEKNMEKAESYSNNNFYDPNKTYTCEGLISDDLEAVIQFALKIVRIAAPILLIILCAIDFSQAVMSGDQDALKKSTSKVVKRAIAALALFLVPFFVSLAIDWVDDSEYFNKDATKCTEVLK